MVVKRTLPIKIVDSVRKGSSMRIPHVDNGHMVQSNSIIVEKMANF